MMKETILFSNVIGDITSQNEECSFNKNTICLLANAISNNQNLAVERCFRHLVLHKPTA